MPSAHEILITTFPRASRVFTKKSGARAATADFERLNQYFLMTNMQVVSSQYWNQVHGHPRKEHGILAEDARHRRSKRSPEAGIRTPRVYELYIVTAVNEIVPPLFNFKSID